MKSKTDAERNERFYKALAIDTIIEEFFIWYSKGSIIPKFRRQLRKIGYRITRDIDMQYYCQQHPKETRKLILEYYSKTQNLCDKDFFIMCLCSRENSDLFDFFMNEYKKYSSIEREENNICNIIADLLYITRDIKYKEEYLKYYNCIQRDHKKYWIGSYYIWVIKILGDFQLEEAVPQLIEEIKTRSGKYYDAALEALKKYDNQKRFQKVYDSNQKWSKGNFYDMDLKKLALHDKKIKTGLFPEQSTIPEFELFLQGKFGLTTKLSVQDYCQEHPNETKSIVIEFYRKSKLLFDQQFYLGCLKNSENKDLFQFLVKELKVQARKRILYDFTSSINSFFIYSRDKSLEEKYVKTLTQERFNIPVYGIFEAVTKLKLKGVEPLMLEISKNEDDPDTEQALNYFIHAKNIENYEKIFKKYLNSLYLGEIKLAKKGLEKIKSKKEKFLKKKNMT